MLYGVKKTCSLANFGVSKGGENVLLSPLVSHTECVVNIYSLASFVFARALPSNSYITHAGLCQNNRYPSIRRPDLEAYLFMLSKEIMLFYVIL